MLGKLQGQVFLMGAYGMLCEESYTRISEILGKKFAEGIDRDDELDEIGLLLDTIELAQSKLVGIINPDNV